MKHMEWLFCAIVCLVGKSSAFRTEVLKVDLPILPGVKGDFYLHNQCTFPINILAQNGFFSAVLHAQNQVPTGDVWHPPNKLQTKFIVCVGLEFVEGKEAKYELAKYIGTEVVLFSLAGTIGYGAAVVGSTAAGGLMLGWAATALVGVGIVCPLCVAGGITASAVTLYGFASGIEMVVTKVLNKIEDQAEDLLASKKRNVASGGISLSVYSFQGLMFPDDRLAQAAVSKTIFHWSKHLRETDREIQGALQCSDEKDCAQRYAARVYLPEGVAKAWCDMLNSKFEKSLWPALHGDRHLYVRGGLSLPEYNTALDGWLVAAYTPLFISEEEYLEQYKESEFAACTQIQPGMIEKSMSRCKDACIKSLLGKDICEARCEEKLPSNYAARGVCRGTYISTRRNVLGTWVCCTAGPQTAADAEERLAFPKFCLLNSDCRQPEEGNDKRDGKWACAEAEIPKTKWWKDDKTCWQAPLVADAGEDKRNLLNKFPTWSVKDEIPLY